MKRLFATLRYGFDQWAVSTLLALCACDFDEPEPTTASENPVKIVTVAVQSQQMVAESLATAGNGPGKAPAPGCPEGMREIQGRFCSDVVHHCIKGGRTHTGDDTDEPEPFYCDAYERGYAKCLGHEEPKQFCIDAFEYPNQAGAIPRVMVSWFEAKRLCEAQSKRLCRDDEWTLACEGPERLPYAYGWERDRTACNIDHLWIRPNDGLLASRTATPAEIQAEVDRLSQRVPSGSMPRCKSPYGVMDMGGNVDEWTVNVMLRGKPFQSALKGGHWVSGARNRCRPVTVSHDESTVYYAEGFRCCADGRGMKTPAAAPILISPDLPKTKTTD